MLFENTRWKMVEFVHDGEPGQPPIDDEPYVLRVAHPPLNIVH
jgi:hypothetical protein